MIDEAMDEASHMRKWLIRLLELATEIQGERILINDAEDHFAFMLLCFFNKQIGHSSSLIALGNSVDTSLIARSMLEGMCQIKWTEKDSSVRAFQWRRFVAVYDWRSMNAQIRAGKTIDDSEMREVNHCFNALGSQFYRPKVRKELAKGGSLPKDPHWENWTGKTAREIFESVGEAHFYETAYKSFSGWIHWDSGGFGRVISRQGNEVTYIAEQLAEATRALIIGFHCLSHITELVVNQFQLNHATRLVEVIRGYIEFRRSSP